MTLYLSVPGLNGQSEMREFDVPEGTVPFGIGASCPACGPGVLITQIDWASRTFKCSLGGHVSLPSTIATVDHDNHLRVRMI